MTYSLGMLGTTALSLLALLLGKAIKSKAKLLQRHYIPASVIGGLIVAAVLFVLHQTGVLVFTFDTTIQNVAMMLFFASVGYTASLSGFRRGGKSLFVLAAVVSVSIVLQDLIGVGLAQAFGENKLLGLLLGSASLAGGHGTVSAWGTALEELGAANGSVLGYAAATYGMIAGGVIGGPLAKELFQRKCKGQGSSVRREANQSVEMRVEKLLEICIVLFVCCGMAEVSTPHLTKLLHLISENLKFPTYILAMIYAAVARNLLDAVAKRRNVLHLPVEENRAVGEISLNVFLAIAMTTQDLTVLTHLHTSTLLFFVTSMAVQTVAVVLFVRFLTFPVMNRVCDSTYTATVVCAGQAGFSLGSTATEMANMDAFSMVHGTSEQAELIVPLVGTVFLDFVNAVVLSAFSGIFG